jgi:hypothetical protein
MSNYNHIDDEWAKQYVEKTARTNEGASEGVFVRRDHVLLCEGNASDALIFSQIFYWHSLNKHNKVRLSTEKDNHLWVAKNHTDWETETGLKTRTVRDCLNRMKKSGLIHYMVSGFDGKRTPHIRINWQMYSQKMRTLLSIDSVASDVKRQMQNEQASDVKRQIDKRANDVKRQTKRQNLSDHLTENVKSNTETIQRLSDTTLKDTSSDVSSDIASPIGETMPESKSIETFALQAKESAGPYAYDFDNNPLSRTDYDALLTSFDTMKQSVFWLYEPPKVTRKVTHMIAAQIAHQFMGSKKTKAGKAITGLRKQYAFSDKPATPQEVIAFGIWYKQTNNWIPSQKAEELHEQFTEYRNLPYHGELLRLAEMELLRLLRVRIGEPFPRPDLQATESMGDLLHELTSDIAAERQKGYDQWYDKIKHEIDWYRETARLNGALPSQRREWLNIGFGAEIRYVD